MSSQPVIRKISYPQFVLQAAWEGRVARPMMIFFCVMIVLAGIGALDHPDPLEALRALLVLVGTPIAVFMFTLGLGPYQKENAWRALEAEELGVPLLPAWSRPWEAVQGVAARLRSEQQTAPSIEAVPSARSVDLKPLFDLQGRWGDGDALSKHLCRLTSLAPEWNAVKDALPNTEAQRIDFSLETISASCRSIIDDPLLLHSASAREDFVEAITGVRERMARAIDKAIEQRSSSFSAEMRAVAKAMKS